MPMTDRLRAAWPAGIAILVALALSGCSTTAENSGLSLVDASGNHSAGFVSTHPSFAAPSGAACQPCHGGDLRGGISKVSCFSASLNGVACHAGGPAFHPESWLDCTSVRTSREVWHATAYQDNLLVNGNTCVQCHTPPALDNVPSGICVRCHFTLSGARVPAGSSWAHGTLAGHSAFQDNAAAKAVCMACHEVHNRFGHPPDCHNCHEPFPSFAGHAASWLDCTVRGTNDWHATAYANNFLVNGYRCDECHILSAKCTLCHFDIGGRKVPLGSSWTHGDDGHDDFRSDIAVSSVCIACHETHNRFGHPPECHNCHEPFP
jgi:hypothetical protein